MADHTSALAHHFDDLKQQREACELGMWIFLVTEFMFFGGLFMAYLAYRYWYPSQFVTGSHTMSVILGTMNTAVLLTSSLTMALAVHAAEISRRKSVLVFLSLTILLGSIFLGVKAYEYHHKYEEHLIPFAGLPFHFQEEGSEGIVTFFNLYFVMTGLHALHMVIGIGVLAWLLARAARGYGLGEGSIAMHNTGLYWHFVDLVWVYLFPFFYLVGARGGGGGVA